MPRYRYPTVEGGSLDLQWCDWSSAAMIYRVVEGEDGPELVDLGLRLADVQGSEIGAGAAASVRLNVRLSSLIPEVLEEAIDFRHGAPGEGAAWIT